MKITRRKVVVLTLKLAVAAALLYLAIRNVDWHDHIRRITNSDGTVRTVEVPGFGTILRQAHLTPMIAALGCFTASIFIVAIRWWYLLRVLRIRLHWYEAVRLTYLGYFFNFIVPGVVSGDLVKAWYVFKHTDRKAAALVSIFVDRVTGLMMFALMAAGVLAGLAVTGHWKSHLTMPAGVVALVLTVLVLGSAAMLIPTTRRIFGRLLAFGPLKHHLDVAGKAVELYRRRFGALLGAAGFTFFSQAIHITGILLLGTGLDLASPWHAYYLYAPLIYIIAAVPLSPGGLGVMEFCFVTFFATGAVTDNEALALALLVRLGPMICSAPGLVVAMTGAKLPPTEQMAAEME
jgi:uncharacterized membrane protein YbhN (UPF0104 family)